MQSKTCWDVSDVVSDGSFEVLFRFFHLCPCCFCLWLHHVWPHASATELTRSPRWSWHHFINLYWDSVLPVQSFKNNKAQQPHRISMKNKSWVKSLKKFKKNLPQTSPHKTIDTIRRTLNSAGIFLEGLLTLLLIVKEKLEWQVDKSHKHMFWTVIPMFGTSYNIIFNKGRKYLIVYFAIFKAEIEDRNQNLSTWLH